MRGPAGAVVALVAIALTVLSLGRPCAASRGVAETSRYERADAPTIKTCTREILADPRFAPRKTFRQWLNEKLSKWDRPDITVSDGVERFILWAVVSWCVLSLLAILIHFAWTIWIAVRRPKSAAIGVPHEGAELYEQLSDEQLWRKSQELAGQGAFRQAVGVLLIALLRRLEGSSVLRFHTSKTNGEYLREYPSDVAGRSQFTQFIGLFERSIYGGLDVAGPTYETMNSLAQRIVSDVDQRPQI